VRSVVGVASPLIPLFPLGTVLFPGSPLALHIFEDRYRALMADLLGLPVEERRFGVITIRSGYEVGVHGVRALHEVGCMAVITAVKPAPDGTYDVESVGSTRFRIRSLDHDRPYLRGTVEWLAEPAGEIGALAEIVAQRYADYRRAIGGLRGVSVESASLPSDARLLSYLVAATVIASTTDRQRFLAEADAASRLASEARWLTLEAALVRALSAIPAGRMIDVPSSIN
jgi:Lon protease-like protein